MAQLRFSGGQPLVKRPDGGAGPDVEITLPRLVVLRTVHPRVVRDLVVVPDGDDGRGRVQPLQTRVAPVELLSTKHAVNLIALTENKEKNKLT